MPFLYHSEQVHANYVNSEGQTRRNIVHVENGKGTKTLEIMNAKGKTVKKTKKALTKAEIAKIKANRFIPGLFTSMRSKTRRHG